MVNYYLQRIISEISDSDLYEPEYKSLSNLQNEANKTGNIDNKNTVEYLSQFSKYWDHSRKEADLKQIKYTQTFKRNIIKRQLHKIYYLDIQFLSTTFLICLKKKILTKM